MSAWPADITVPPPPMKGRQRTPEPGHEEGELCLRNAPGFPTCLGKLELRHAPADPDGYGGSCYCWRIQAPCSHCLSEVPECPQCGHREPEPC